MRKNVLSWKIIKYLTAAAIVLQFVTLWIQTRFGIINEDQNVKDETHSMDHTLQFKKLSDSILHESQLDASNQYKFTVDIFNKEQAAYSQSVALISHCSEDQLHLLPDLLQHWKGLLSISVFVTRNGVATIFNLRRCFPIVKKNVIFNVVFPVTELLHTTPEQNFSCKREMKYMRKNSFELGIPYPINLMRNVGKKGAHSLYHFTVDIDMIPNQSLYTDLITFFDKERHGGVGEHMAYVIPAYEMSEDILLPSNKLELLQLSNRRLIRPFYQELCEKCQFRTDYSSWENAKNVNDSLHPLYEVTWADSWEPFYVSLSNVPFYDERFTQYGFNRISQVCELHTAGYSFLVLNTGFLVHRGLKNNYSHHRSKRKELMKNLNLYESFKNELLAKYPYSHKRC